MSDLRVLIVEDEPLIALNLEFVIVDLGHQVCGVARSFNEAVQLAERTLPQVALVDLNLIDGRTGLLVADHLTRRFATQVIMATANAEDIPAGTKLLAILRKPYTDEAVSQQIALAGQRVTDTSGYMRAWGPSTGGP